MIIPAIAIRKATDKVRAKPWGAFWREPATATRKERKRVQYFATQAEAERFKVDMVAELKRRPEEPAPPPVITTTAGTIGRYLSDWLTLTIKPKREAATYRSYEQLTRLHLVPTIVDGVRFGDLPLVDLRRVHVKKLFEELHRVKRSYATRKHAHAVLSSACAAAVLDEELEYNPCEKIGRLLRHKGEQGEDPQPNPFTREQADAFLAYVVNHEPEWTEYFQFLHDTGVRVGEIAALTWPHVDLERKRAEIVASYSPSDNADKDPKTHQCRWIDLSDVVVDQLRAWKGRQRAELFKRGQSNKRQYVFTNRRGSPRRQDGNMRRVFDRVLIKATIGAGDEIRPAFTEKEGHTPHDLRDTFATTHLSTDYSRLPWVSRQLGHETERTTVEHYFRFLPSTVTKGFANQIR